MSRASNACDRLAATRGQLRLALRAQLEPAKPINGSRSSGWLSKLWSRLKSSPRTHPLAQGIEDWVARSPLPMAAWLAANALDATLRPLAQSNPWRLVMGAFVLGGVLAWCRPWRHVLTPAILATMLPRLLATLAGNVSRPTWITLATVLLNRKRDGSQV